MFRKQYDASNEDLDVSRSDFGVRITPRTGRSNSRDADKSYRVQPNNPEVHRRLIKSLKSVMNIQDGRKR